MSRALQDKLASSALVGDGLRLAADSAFPVGGAVAGKIVTPIKEGDLDRVPPECRLGMVAMSEAITSLRQAAEWGMGSTTKVYRQLEKPLPYQASLRQHRLENMFRLYNLRVRETGISQIRNVFGV